MLLCKNKHQLGDKISVFKYVLCLCVCGCPQLKRNWMQLSRFLTLPDKEKAVGREPEREREASSKSMGMKR